MQLIVIRQLSGDQLISVTIKKCWILLYFHSKIIKEGSSLQTIIEWYFLYSIATKIRLVLSLHFNQILQAPQEMKDIFELMWNTDPNSHMKVFPWNCDRKIKISDQIDTGLLTWIRWRQNYYDEVKSWAWQLALISSFRFWRYLIFEILPMMLIFVVCFCHPHNEKIFQTLCGKYNVTAHLILQGYSSLINAIGEPKGKAQWNLPGLCLLYWTVIAVAKCCTLQIIQRKLVERCSYSEVIAFWFMNGMPFKNMQCERSKLKGPHTGAKLLVRKLFLRKYKKDTWSFVL